MVAHPQGIAVGKFYLMAKNSRANKIKQNLKKEFRNKCNDYEYTSVSYVTNTWLLKNISTYMSHLDFNEKIPLD